MQGILNQKKIDYLLYHLNHHIVLTKEIKSRFFFCKDSNINDIQNRIIFNLSEKALSDTKNIDNVVILFPRNTHSQFFFIDEFNNLVFNDDLLKSAFYLLSGYQETQFYESDNYGRFPYSESIQKKYDFVDIPIVNKYFSIIINGIEEFCHRHHIEFKKRKLWDGNDFGFMLTHDIDRVDKWTIHEVKLRAKNILKVSSSNWVKSVYLFFESFIKFFSGDNPYWCFGWLKKLEKKYRFCSTWFFLPQGEMHIDAYYSFEESRIIQLANQLLSDNDEISVHGTYLSRTDEKKMKSDKQAVEKLISDSSPGIRQHWLSFIYPQTLRLQESTGFKYDSSWSYADHIGWRNSYCLPFRPYDLEKDKMMDIWEIPLCVMDRTLFDYQRLNFTAALKNVKKIINQVNKYNGLFVLLWHNSCLENNKNIDFKEFYITLLEYLSQQKMISVKPNDIITSLSKL